MKVDMSPKAISARLRQVSELRDLCLYLGRVGKEHRRRLAEATAGELTTPDAVGPHHDAESSTDKL